MNTTLRRYLLLAVAALFAAGCQDLTETPTTPSASDRSNARLTPGATFDWTVPERFGLDEDGDGLTDYLRTVEEISPPSWPVDFDACDIEGGTRYVWHVDRRRVASVDSCRYTHEFPAEGTYDVAVHVVFSPGASVWAEEVVTVQDWLIVSFGDSYASGEGVPEVPAANDALVRAIEDAFADLQDARAHRDAARDHFEAVFEEKGLWDDILERRRQRRQEFRDACSDVEDWDDVVTCKNFLTDRGLSFTAFSDAQEHFQDLVSNAQERVNDLADALAEAQAALNSAISAVENIRSAIQALANGISNPVWQEPYPNETWGEENCHRSANAAPARAAAALERSDPRTSVTFVHLACTGAQMTVHRAQMTEQVPWADELVGPREIDAVLLSIGGNDAGFADIATACAGQQPCYVENPVINPADASLLCGLMGLIGFGSECSARFGIDLIPTESAATILTDGVTNTLPGRYEQLATEMFPGLTGLLEPEVGPGSAGRGRPGSTSDPVDRLRSERVYITEYVDMTKDDALAYCRFDRTDPLGTIPGITADEMDWLDNTATTGINGAVERAASLHGWNYVSQIYTAYAPHGYCAEDHWVVRVHETFLTQLGEKGVAHPNNLGHILNGQAILAELAPDLYPDGMDGAPRAPDVPTVPAL